MAITMTPLAASAVITTTSAPTMGYFNRYNATSGALTVTLPALSGLNVSARVAVQKYSGDFSGNAVTFNCAGSDKFDDTATTQLVLQTTGDQRELQVVSVSGTKRWKVVGTLQTQSGGGGAASVLAPTAVKTSGYTAAGGDLVPADATAGGFTVTLPPAPADKSVIAVKKLDASANAVTVQRSGSDVFNVSGGATSMQLTLQDQTVSLQYKASGAIWYVTGYGTPVAGLDTHFFVRSVSAANSRLTDLNGAVSLGLETIAGAVNYLNLLNAATGGSVVLRAQGADNNIGFEMRPKGTGYFSLQDGSNNTVAGFQGVTSAVNLWWIQSSATGNAVTAAALGADTNIGINFIPKGSGTVQANGNPVGVKVAVPATATSTGVPGQWAADSSFIYVCTATNVWRRAAVAAW